MMKKQKSDCPHHWHLYTGPILMVIPHGHVVQDCCVCNALRTIHKGHVKPRI